MGAAIGGVAGAVAGSVVNPPPAEVRTYVASQPVTSVIVDGAIAVGQPIPQTVQVVSVPQYEAYSYAVVNDQRVIVDPQTRVVIDIVD